MATGGENYKIQCLSTYLSSELTNKPKKSDRILREKKEEKKSLHCGV